MNVPKENRVSFNLDTLLESDERMRELSEEMSSQDVEEGITALIETPTEHLRGSEQVLKIMILRMVCSFQELDNLTYSFDGREKMKEIRTRAIGNF